MTDRIRPEPRLPVTISLILLVGIGSYEAMHYRTSEAGTITVVETVIDAEIEAHRLGRPYSEITGSDSKLVVDAYIQKHGGVEGLAELGALEVAPVDRVGQEESFALTMSGLDAKRCRKLAGGFDTRITRTLVNGEVLRDEHQTPSGFAVWQACRQGGIVTLELGPNVV
jgi:hypothetical protein